MSRLNQHRMRAYRNQQGRCYYCNQHMWVDSPREFTQQYNLSIQQAAQLRCTTEHLTPQRLGGCTTLCNIAAACWYCNRMRPRRRRYLDPVKYGEHVRKRVRNGKWHRLLTI